MNFLFKEIADIRSGYTFRGKTTESKGSGVYMLQIKDVKDNTEIDSSALIEIKWDGKPTLPIIEQGEIVIVARGTTNRAALMVDSQTVIPSNQLMIIQVKSNNISPEYLCWYLNRPETQKILSHQHMGTSIPSLSKQALSNLTVPVPTLENQEKIVELNRLQQQEKSLYEQLINNRQKILDGVFQQLLNNGENK